VDSHIHSRTRNHGIHETVETHQPVCLPEILPITVLNTSLEQVVVVERQEVCLLGVTVLYAETLGEKIAQVENAWPTQDNLPVENSQQGRSHSVAEEQVVETKVAVCEGLR
jgi:hypothetical protein